MIYATLYPIFRYHNPIPWVLCLYYWICPAYSKEENITQILDHKGIMTRNEDLTYLGEKERESPMY